MAAITMEHLVKKYDDGFPAVNDISIDIADGEFLILVGPSGCGKSTLLRMVVGLEDITSGDLKINGERVNERQPRERNLSMVFQNYALYPHLSVFENIAFPLRLAKGQFSNDEIDRKVREAAETLDLTEHLERKPANLSGGQRQRVAMGRAIVRDADAFLFDEPLSNLDAKLRGQMRTEIAQLQRRMGITSIYVTHDQTEAMTLGDRVAVLKRGQLQQIASPRELYEQPVNLFVAGFIGAPSMNFIPARIEGGTFRTPIGDIEVPERVRARLSGAPELVLLGLRPEHFEDAKFVDEAKVGHGTMFDAEFTHTEWLGNQQYGYIHYQQDDTVQHKLNELAQELDADEMPAQVVVSLDASSRIRGGSNSKIWLDSRRMHVFNPETGENLTRDAEAGAELTREANEERESEIARARQRDGAATASGAPARSGQGADGGSSAAR
ncbi:sn-glycerol-3-phosphate ABC transporter ATP-binding protein UgpC [Kocuria rhizophila]|uniref:ABC transporter ATP-binding protein n=1 Tax=Kocuria rhizophila TaxID=72000 RepID=UPI0007504FB0|nr:sn-glycerol-3-phosphate ABC transporter ATP-binding protein UgpC [Kocuria rhizophila]KUP26642.1 ABC transporter [Kocuria rhizophila]MBO4144606.1 sn-glycerol-3-phosphate ABC transporter ATP-binding protein UgpC [Kocuria rhizophila]MDR7373183.1 multiple sugar transport system ATP-binding protein [Kocuria rhizophila]QTK31890.1 sn-glycerol-3-phosphate ABC transporter ATP-binding protein UgpC [Kocuria rhizophila]WSY87613.1 sn-glycerol-3-phosphate ABC transporter ATP-binding protein UgpC [Kocuria